MTCLAPPAIYLRIPMKYLYGLKRGYAYFIPKRFRFQGLIKKYSEQSFN